MHVSGAPDSLLQLLEIRPLSIDDLSTARYVVSAAFLRAAKGHYSAADVEAFAAFVRSPHYADILLGNRAYSAWVGSEMVGVAAWSPGEQKSPTARILAIFVHPLFSGNGIGTRLGEFLADEAAAAGYRALETSATLNAVPFFERLGYIEMRRAAWGLPSGRDVPIAFMRKIAGGSPGIIH
ncbi:MAG: GNAT family N-acetyltransferase [Hyphomicrobium sp.]